MNMTNLTNITTDAVVYCGKGLDDFHTQFVKYHGYASLVVCLFGSIANSLNIAVLTRREMRSPTNAILTGLAIADLLVMIDYIPYSILEFILPGMNYPREKRLSYFYVLIILFHSIFTLLCHTISIWLTVTLAVWRYIAVAYPQKNRIWCGMKITLITIASSYIICPLLTIPPFLTFSITPSMELVDDDGNAFNMSLGNISEARNVTLYKIQPSNLARNNVGLMRANFWIYSVVMKIIPCIALTILSLRLICALLETKRRRKQLTGNCNGMKTIVNGKTVDKPKARKNSKTIDKEKQTDRTTKMLLAVLLLFLITEFPQGILGLLSAVLGEEFFMQCYVKLGELTDILALINSAINFILYCTMSRQFRTTFSLLFRPKFFDKWLPIPQDGDNQLGQGYADGKDNNGHTTHVTQITQV